MTEHVTLQDPTLPCPEANGKPLLGAVGQKMEVSLTPEGKGNTLPSHTQTRNIHLFNH